VEKIDGEYQISLNGEQIPHLRISNTYKDIMSQDGNGSEVKDYIRDKIRSGKFLIKSIHQRQQTISNIAHQIVQRQREFLDHGSAHLKPMTMVQIADAVGVHETTVSRAISGKYMATPQGVFEMKYFFTPGYQTSTREKRGRQRAAQRQGDRRDPERARHPDRPPHGREISHRAEHPAVEHAAEVLRAARAQFSLFRGRRLP
jgi:RNA polymerase sigma-54 factor